MMTKAEGGGTQLRGRPRMAGNGRDGERQGRCLPWSLQMERDPADTLILGFEPPEP